MSRTLVNVQSDLSVAYAAQAAIINNERINEAYFASAESSRRYIMEGVTLQAIRDWIMFLKEEELAFLQLEQQANPVFRTNATIPLNVSKFGNSRGCM
jgi:hypothetical protein